MRRTETDFHPLLDGGWLTPWVLSSTKQHCCFCFSFRGQGPNICLSTSRCALRGKAKWKNISPSQGLIVVAVETWLIVQKKKNKFNHIYITTHSAKVVSVDRMSYLRASTTSVTNTKRRESVNCELGLKQRLYLQDINTLHESYYSHGYMWIHEQLPVRAAFLPGMEGIQLCD